MLVMPRLAFAVRKTAQLVLQIAAAALLAYWFLFWFIKWVEAGCPF